MKTYKQMMREFDKDSLNSQLHKVSNSCSSPQDFLDKIRQVLAKSSVHLPQVSLNNDQADSISVKLSHPETSGESIKTVTGPFQEPQKDHTLSIQYKQKSGSYKCNAVIK